MKKFFIVMTAVMLTVPAFAHRDYYRRGHGHHHHHSDGDTVALASSAGLFLGLSTASAAARIEIRLIQDDAAMYLASGEMTATLGEALVKMKALNPNMASASDEELAAALLQ